MIHGTGTHSVDPSVADNNNIIESQCSFHMNYPVNELFYFRSDLIIFQ